MNQAEEPAILLEALEQGFISPNVVIHWSDEVIVATEKPANWLIELSTVLKDHTEDVLTLLRNNSTPLPSRRKTELLAAAWRRGLLPLREALPRLFRITIIERRDRGPREPIEKPLFEALVSWDGQEDLDVISPELTARFEAALTQFLPGAADIQQFLRWDQ